MRTYSNLFSPYQMTRQTHTHTIHFFRPNQKNHVFFFNKAMDALSLSLPGHHFVGREY